MTVAGTLSPFNQVSVTVMPAGSHERDMDETVKRHSAVCAMAIPFTAGKHRTSLLNRWVGLQNHPNTHTVSAPRAPNVVLHHKMFF